MLIACLCLGVIPTYVLTTKAAEDTELPTDVLTEFADYESELPGRRKKIRTYFL